MVLRSGTGTHWYFRHAGHKQVFFQNVKLSCKYRYLVVNLAMQIFIFLRTVAGSKNHCTILAGACLNFAASYTVIT